MVVTNDPNEPEITTEERIAVRKDAALRIDPETSVVMCTYARTLDPYGDDPDLPEEYCQVRRTHFVRSPGSDVWVMFNDLPAATRDALRKRSKEKSASDDELFFL
jgi:hypothetical protein